MKFVMRLFDKRSIRKREGEDAAQVDLGLKLGEFRVWKGVYYKGNIRVNVAGHWKDGFKEPLYVVTNLEPREGMKIYKERMKIDQSFRDLKNLLAIDKNMSKTKDRMEKLMGRDLP
jgi:transposase